MKTDPNLSQALHLMNGDAVNDRIARGGVVEKMINGGKSNDEIIRELFLRTFGRAPAPVEIKSVTDAIAAEPASRKVILEDAFWALMNSKEFYFNH